MNPFAACNPLFKTPDCDSHWWRVFRYIHLSCTQYCATGQRHPLPLGLWVSGNFFFFSLRALPLLLLLYQPFTTSLTPSTSLSPTTVCFCHSCFHSLPWASDCGLRSFCSQSVFIFTLCVLIDSYQDLLGRFRQHPGAHAYADVSQPITERLRGRGTLSHSVQGGESTAIYCWCVCAFANDVWVHPSCECTSACACVRVYAETLTWLRTPAAVFLQERVKLKLNPGSFFLVAGEIRQALQLTFLSERIACSLQLTWHSIANVSNSH